MVSRARGVADVPFSVFPLNGVISSRRPAATNTVLFNMTARGPRALGERTEGAAPAVPVNRGRAPPAGEAARGPRQAGWGGAAAELEHTRARGTPVPDGRPPSCSGGGPSVTLTSAQVASSLLSSRPAPRSLSEPGFGAAPWWTAATRHLCGGPVAF